MDTAVLAEVTPAAVAQLELSPGREIWAAVKPPTWRPIPAEAVAGYVVLVLRKAMT